MIRLIKYNQAENLINEGDILLFRGRLYYCIFPNIAWIVAKIGGGIHTHSGMASWSGKILECLEFRELKGGRAVNLKHQVDLFPGRIDVFRVKSPSCYFDLEYNKITIEYNPYIITEKFRELTGHPYSHISILEILFHSLFAKHDFLNKNLEQNNFNKFVCSTVIAELFKQNYVNLYPLKKTKYISPSNLAHSAMLQYLFTLDKN
mgnify:CR=1 FL=1